MRQPFEKNLSPGHVLGSTVLLTCSDLVLGMILFKQKFYFLCASADHENES